MQKQKESEQKSVSVIIPFYKAEQYFADALASVKAQTYSVSEIIVVNDGGGNDVEQFLRQFDDITIINLTENMGPSKARNIGIKAATSPWIAFCDADDIWLPTKLAAQVAFLKMHPEFSACHTGVITFNEHGDISTFKNKPYDLNINESLTSSHVTPPSLLIKKSVLEKVNYFDEKMQCSEDHDLTIRVIEQGFKIGFVNQTLIRVRRMNHGNVSSNSVKVVIGNLQLLHKNYHLFKRTKGLTSFFIFQTFMTAGGKSEGLEKKFYYLCGKLIKSTFKFGNTENKPKF